MRLFGSSIFAILIGGSLALLAGTASAAAADPDVDLKTLQVFAKGNIKAVSSDYQGATAARGDIDLTDFSIDGPLTSGGRLSFSRGSVDGMIISSDRTLSQVNSEGTRSSNPVGLELASKNLDRLSSALSALPATAQAITSQSNASDKWVQTIEIHATRNTEVVELQPDQLKSAGWDQLQVNLRGESTSRLLVRVSGSDVRLRHVGFSTSGGIDPSNIVFFFPEAERLEISESGGATGRSGQLLGIPGSVVAPNASMRFGSALITGQVFVRDILPISGQPSGQINRLPEVERGAGLVASQRGSALLASQMSGLLQAGKVMGCLPVN